MALAVKLSGTQDLGVNEWRILLYLGVRGGPQGETAQSLIPLVGGGGQPRVSRTLKNLRERGFVECQNVKRETLGRPEVVARLAQPLDAVLGAALTHVRREAEHIEAEAAWLRSAAAEHGTNVERLRKETVT